MGAKKVLLMYISNVSGHHRASLAIQKALQEVDGTVQTKSIDAFNYTNPFLEKFINKLYVFVIKAVPRIWDYLYDNENVLKRVRKIRRLIHKLNDKKIKKLFDDFRPDIVVCTQAFPCGMVADYKRRHNLNIPLIGVLTDYAPHGYWLNDSVDIYIVPVPKIKQKLIQRGIPQQRLKVLGIPIDTKFRNPGNPGEVLRRLGIDSNLPVILIMGGGQGLGPIKKIVHTLDKLRQPVQLIVVCGTNRSLYKWLKRNEPLFNKPVAVMHYTERIDELMSISSFIVTKPGGLTSAEALSKSLPIIIASALPGQESLNTHFLLETGIALKMDSFAELRSLAEALLSDSERLEKLRRRAHAAAPADSALKTAQLILSMIGEPRFNS